MGLGAPCQEQGRLDPCDLDRASLATSVGGGLAMNTRWITDFRALRTLLPVVAESDSYDHDAVSNEELDELFAGVEAESSTPEVNVPPRGPDKSPVAAAEEHVALPQTDAREASPNVEVPRGGIAVEEGPRPKASRVGEECGSTCRTRWLPIHKKK